MAYTINENCNGCGACKKICPTAAISGTSKKLHTINADGCIECGVCGRLCPKEAVQDSFGKKCVMIKKSEWEKPSYDNKKCNSCNICIDSCPVGCLALSGAMGKDPHGYPYLKDDKACISCGFCASDCPVDAITMVKP